MIVRWAHDVVNQLWYENRYPWLVGLLLPLSVVFCILVQIRDWLYRQRWLSAYRCTLPVLVVGNLSVGGTGKTPVVTELATALMARGFRPGILCRGYRGRATAQPQWVTAQSDPAIVGDEALLLARRTGLPVVAAIHRVAGAKALIASGCCDLIVMDDGLQHYALARTLEVAVMDGKRRFGNGYCLPAGPLREPLSRLERVPIHLITQGSSDHAFSVQLQALRIVNIVNPRHIGTLEDLNRPGLVAIAGIGHPQRFFLTLEQHGLSVEPVAFPDHHDFTAKDLEPYRDRPIIMTEKDAVKCQSIAGPDHWYLEVRAVFDPMLLDLIIQHVENNFYGSQPPEYSGLPSVQKRAALRQKQPGTHL